jgi:hypothetical protein
MAAGGMIVQTGRKGYVLLNAKTAADATGIGVLPDEWGGTFVETTVYVTFDSTAAAGVVLIESAPTSDYAGTWVTEGTVTFASASKAHRVSINAILGALRARITSAVTSGTVTATAWVSTNS